jgi:hypothetical protein
MREEREKNSRKDAKAQRLRPCRTERFRFRSDGRGWPAKIGRATQETRWLRIITCPDVLVPCATFASVLIFAPLRLCVSFSVLGLRLPSAVAFVTFPDCEICLATTNHRHHRFHFLANHAKVGSCLMMWQRSLK